MYSVVSSSIKFISCCMHQERAKTWYVTLSYPILMKSQTSEGKKRNPFTGSDKIGEQGRKAEQKF